MSGGRLHSTSGTKFTLKQTEGSQRREKGSLKYFTALFDRMTDYLINILFLAIRLGRNIFFG